MNTYPAKLIKYLQTLSEHEQEQKKELYDRIYDTAVKNKFQSARFWAMRQIVSGLSSAQIDQKIKKRLHKILP